MWSGGGECNRRNGGVVELMRRFLRAAAACGGSEGCGEGFEGIGDDGCAVEGAEFFGIGDGVEGVAEAVGDGAEAEVEGFEDGLAAGMGRSSMRPFSSPDLKPS